MTCLRKQTNKQKSDSDCLIASKAIRGAFCPLEYCAYHRLGDIFQMAPIIIFKLRKLTCSKQNRYIAYEVTFILKQTKSWSEQLCFKYQFGYCANTLLTDQDAQPVPCDGAGEELTTILSFLTSY